MTKQGGHGPRTLALGASQPFVYRELIERVIIVIAMVSRASSESYFARRLSKVRGAHGDEPKQQDPKTAQRRVAHVSMAYVLCGHWTRGSTRRKGCGGVRLAAVLRMGRNSQRVKYPAKQEPPRWWCHGQKSCLCRFRAKVAGVFIICDSQNSKNTHKQKKVSQCWCCFALERQMQTLVSQSWRRLSPSWRRRSAASLSNRGLALAESWVSRLRTR